MAAACRTTKLPRSENILYLNGTGSGLVNNACFPSTVAPSYAPSGQVSGDAPYMAAIHISMYLCMYPVGIQRAHMMYVCVRAMLGSLGSLQISQF
jgi:hypothetical protein